MLVATEPLARHPGRGGDSGLVLHMPTGANGESCKACAMRPCCAVNPEVLACAQPMDDLTLGHRVVRKGEPLYRVGDKFRNIYAVRTGSFKKVSLLSDGREQVTGFYVAGEPLGLDGIFDGQYASDAVALEDSSVCIMPFELLELLGREVKAVSHHVYRMLSAEVVRENSQAMLLGTMTAEERVATFLVDMSRRWQERAYSPTKFVLRMTRREAGSFLGLKLETVSRTLSRLRQNKLIEVSGKEIRILDLDGLREAGHARC